MAHPGAFCVYATVDVDLSELLSTLNYGIFGDSDYGDQWYPQSQSFIHRLPSSIIQHHRSQPGPFNKKYFVIVDRVDWKSEGVLGVNLADEGFLDAARLRANIAGSSIPSVSVGNSDWSEGFSDAIKPPHFAVYATADFKEGEDPPRKLLEALNFGMESRKETAPPVCGLVSQRATSEDVGPVAKNHLQVSAEGPYDPRLFIFADDADADEYGVLIVRLSGDGEADTCRKPVDVAAEVLTWVQIGLYTWQEGKDWDDEQQEVEE